MSAKKRKAAAASEERPAKRPAQEPSNSDLQVSFIAGADVAKPAIATAPGVSLPADLEYDSFSKALTNGTSQLLLHSSTHPTIDFKATEGNSSADKYLKHYVALFDPATKKLQVTEAKRMTVRSCIRRREPDKDNDEGPEDMPVTNYSARAALTHAFGTKKSKKAVQSIAENRLLSQGGDDADNPLSKAILSSMPSPEPVDEMTTPDRSNKPLPLPNLATTDIDQVYPLTSLVFPHPPSSTLEEIPISYWRETISKKNDIKSISRFVSNRVGYLIPALLADPSNDHILLKVRLLRYLLLLLEFFAFIRRFARAKPIPSSSSWPKNTISGNIPINLLSNLVKHFAPDGTGLSKNQTTLLQTTILALTLHIPPPSLNPGVGVLITEPTDIQLDLAMKPEDIRKLYRELGCKMESPKPAELDRWGLQKKESNQKGPMGLPRPKFAKLSFPIEFPVQSSGRPMQRKR